jgi:hypothetical protein
VLRKNTNNQYALLNFARSGMTASNRIDRRIKRNCNGGATREGKIGEFSV